MNTVSGLAVATSESGVAIVHLYSTAVKVASRRPQKLAEDGDNHVSTESLANND